MHRHRRKIFGFKPLNKHSHFKVYVWCLVYVVSGVCLGDSLYSTSLNANGQKSSTFSTICEECLKNREKQIDEALPLVIREK